MKNAESLQLLHFSFNKSIKNIRRSTICVLLSGILFFPTFKSTAQAVTLKYFLKQNSTIVDSSAIDENVHFFLNPSIKQKITWVTGQLTTTSGVVFENLSLKFNTISNTFFLKQEDKIYRISGYKIQSFKLCDSQIARTFEKNFSIPRNHILNAKFNISKSSILKHLSSFPALDTLNLYLMHLEKKEEIGSLKIEFLSANMRSILDLQKHLLTYPGIWDVELSINETNSSTNLEINKSTFFEILVSSPNFVLLKRNHKSLSRSESVAMVKHSQTNVFSKKDYFLSNSNGEIVELFFNRGSVRKALTFIHLRFEKKIPSISNERKLISYFDSIK